MIVAKSLLHWRWYHDVNCRLVFTHLLLKVTREAIEFGELSLNPGQSIFTIPQLAEEVGISIQQTKTAIAKMERTNDIISQAIGNRFTVFTIINLGHFISYQPTDNRLITDRQPTESLENIGLEAFSAFGLTDQQPTEALEQKGFSSFPSLSSPLHSSPILPQTPFPKTPPLAPPGGDGADFLAREKRRIDRMDLRRTSGLPWSSYAQDILPAINAAIKPPTLYTEAQQNLAPISRRIHDLMNHGKTADEAKALTVEVAKYHGWNRSPEGGNFVSMNLATHSLFGDKMWHQAVLHLKDGKFVAPQKAQRSFQKEPEKKGYRYCDKKGMWHQTADESFACYSCHPYKKNTQHVVTENGALASAEIMRKLKGARLKTENEIIEGGENV